MKIILNGLSKVTALKSNVICSVLFTMKLLTKYRVIYSNKNIEVQYTVAILIDIYYYYLRTDDKISTMNLNERLALHTTDCV